MSPEEKNVIVAQLFRSSSKSNKSYFEYQKDILLLSISNKNEQ